MTDETEHEDSTASLHEAFGAEVADLEIGPSPFSAVMDGGAALRSRRRLAAVSGVAALAMLPVAAVAIFAGGTGGAGGTGKTRPEQAGGTHHGTAPTTPAVSATRPADLIPSPTATLPPQDLGPVYANPDPHDDYTVVAGGTVGGQHWRLVRDLFVAPAYAAPGPGQGGHLPMSQRGRAGTQACDFTGLQWGDRPAGTLPDFDAGGACNPAPDGDVERITSPMMGASRSGMTKDVPLWYISGRVDSSKVSSVVVTIGSRSTTRQPIYTVPGEGDGYYVVFVPPLSFQDEESMGVTGYDAAGRVVAHLDMSTRTAIAH